MSAHDIDMSRKRAELAVHAFADATVLHVMTLGRAITRAALLGWFLDTYGHEHRLAFFALLDGLIAVGRLRAYTENCERWITMPEGFSVDPNTTLERIRDISAKIRGTDDGDAELARLAGDLAAAVQDLDDWLARGGFVPDAWSKGRS